MGRFWSRLFRRREPSELPAGLTTCAGCSEPRGRVRLADTVTAVDAEVDIHCICDGLPCAWCGQMPVHRPASNRYDAATAQVRHAATWAAEAPCPHCLADGAAAAPAGSTAAHYDIGATPFYGEVAASTDYFSGERYRAFESSLPELASRHGVKLLNVKRVQGIWRGQHEPSALISVSGCADSVRSMMVELADRWGQDGVICFSAELDGSARLYSGSTGFTLEEICTLLNHDDFSGITVDDAGELMILDFKGDQSVRARETVRRIGAVANDVEGHGFMHLRIGPD